MKRTLSHRIFSQGLSLSLLAGALLAAGCGAPAGWTVSRTPLDSGWQMRSSGGLPATGGEISGASYVPRGWYPAMVPGTVLGSLVADSLYPDIFFHRNLSRVPDSLFDVPWWYRKTVHIADTGRGQRYRLSFGGISYSADLWVNGHRVLGRDSLRGSFRRYRVDVTPFLHPGANTLALEIWRARPGDLNIGFVDWNPEPQDHNMGLWREVKLEASGPVVLGEPFVETRVDTATLSEAEVAVSVDVHNTSPAPVTGTVETEISGGIRLRKKVTLTGGQTLRVHFTDSAYPQLKISHPRLWWTHDLGKPNLYTLGIRFSERGTVSDSLGLRFGIRSISGYRTPEGFRGYRLNGKKILVKGGGWTDPMLLDASPAYLEAGLDYAVHMNLNTLRMEGFWGSGSRIYDLADEKGLLIMAGFSCQWEWGDYFETGTDDDYGAIITPAQMDMAAASWRDQITWLRNHPSIFLWLYGSDKWPRPALERRYLDILSATDPTRPYVQSAAEHTSVITGPTGMKMRGPYDYVPPVYWYRDTAHGGAFGFNTETGPGPEIPVEESLRKMIPSDSLWPIGTAWLYHSARKDFHNLTRYNRAMDRRLGKARDLTDYLRKAQMLNYEGMRAMFEAFEARRFRATGIIQWMYNASWPKLWWQLYDYYLMPTGAFYGARKANEPLHLAYDYGSGEVLLFNNTLAPAGALTARVGAYDLSMHPFTDTTLTVSSAAGSTTRVLTRVTPPPSVKGTWFLALTLVKGRDTVSRNFYALSTVSDSLDFPGTNWFVTPQSRYADLTGLERLATVTPEGSYGLATRGDSTWISVSLTNPGPAPAFMVHLDWRRAGDGASVVPVFWEDNYCTLMPGQRRTLKAWCHTSDLGGTGTILTVGGWNVAADTVAASRHK